MDWTLFMLWVNLWSIYGVLCGILAKMKGRDSGKWGFLGFLFGVISLIIILCLSENEHESHNKLKELENEKILYDRLYQNGVISKDQYDSLLETITKLTKEEEDVIIAQGESDFEYDSLNDNNGMTTVKSNECKIIKEKLIIGDQKFDLDRVSRIESEDRSMNITANGEFFCIRFNSVQERKEFERRIN